MTPPAASVPRSRGADAVPIQAPWETNSMHWLVSDAVRKTVSIDGYSRALVAAIWKSYSKSDVAADYRKAFGEKPQNLSQIAIQADTDNTHSTSRAEVAELAFVSRGDLASANQNGAGPSVTR
jgi:hypothetical protein